MLYQHTFVSKDNIVQLHADTFSSHLPQTLEGHTRCANCVKYHARDRSLISGSQDGSVGIMHQTEAT